MAESRYIAIANSEVVEALEFPFSNEYLANFITALARNKAHLSDCTEFGSALFDALFRRSIRDLYRHLAGGGGWAADRRLRLTIATAVPELMVVPWELLCESRTGTLPQFLAYHHATYLARSLRLFDRARFSDGSLGGEELRILLVSANPIREVSIDVKTEERMLRFVMDEAPFLEKVQLYHLGNASVNALRKALADFRPQIVHLACHGTYDREERVGKLVLAAEGNHETPDAIDSYRFAILMKEVGSVQLVFLNTCHGASQDSQGVFSGLAQCLHANDIPCVVALQYVLLDKTAHAVVLNFYRYLLRDRLSVEESVGHVRRFLFLNRCMLQECFGIALYQGNVSLSWPSAQPARQVGRISRQSFSEIVDAFQQAQRTLVFDKVSTELTKIRGLMAGLESMEPADVLLMIHIFGEPGPATEILRRVSGRGIVASVFLPLVRLALVLCQTRHEQEELVTGFVILPTDPEEYLRAHSEVVSEVLAPGFYEDTTRRILDEAIKVDAERRAFALLVRPGEKSPVRELVVSLPQVPVDHDVELESYGDPRWRALASLTRHDWIALLLPGGARIKLLVAGEQIAEYRDGRWNHFDVEDFRAKISGLSEVAGCERSLLFDIVGKAFLSSERAKGRLFVIQGTDDVLSHCHAGYKRIAPSDELVGKPVTEIESSHFLKLVEGDNAAILSRQGQVLAINAALAPLQETIVQRVPGTGSRHLAAQKLTKETDSIAIVVSDDGPVSVFFQGELVIRRL